MTSDPILVTGGAGFIGSALARKIINETDAVVVTADKLTYAGNLESLASVARSSRHHFVRVDVCDAAGMRSLFARYQPVSVVHLAAESHVGRSIDGPAAFVQTNVVGTFTLLEEARRYWSSLSGARRERFRVLHVSTDEVFGSLGDGGYFDERTPYAPSSPYSASKAGSDHLVRAWHADALLAVLMRGRIGETYRTRWERVRSGAYQGERLGLDAAQSDETASLTASE